MGYRALATAVLVVHFAYLAYLVIGGFLAWRWPRLIWAHLVAAAWGVALIGLGLDCPLTYAEDWARRRAGESGLTRGFVDRYLEGVIYPQRYAVLAQVLVALVVVASWVGVMAARRPPRPARTRPRSRTR